MSAKPREKPVGRPRSGTARILHLLLLTTAFHPGCGSKWHLDDPCGLSCTEPDDPANDGDKHHCFDFQTPEVNFDPPRSGTPIEVPELQDFKFSWSYFYQWDPCRGSTPGQSGNFTVRWWLEVGGSRVWECTDSVDPLCPMDNVLMGTSSGGSSPTNTGLTVPGDKLKDFLTCSFCVSLDVSDAQECSDDPGNAICGTGQPNSNCLQFNVVNCPCDEGHNKKDLLVQDLDVVDGKITWTNVYDWEQCGQEPDQITEKTGIFSEHITVTLLAGGGTVYETSRSAPSVDLNSFDPRSIALPTLNCSSYSITVELSDIDPSVECQDTPGNNKTTITASIGCP